MLKMIKTKFPNAKKLKIIDNKIPEDHDSKYIPLNSVEDLIIDKSMVSKYSTHNAEEYWNKILSLFPNCSFLGLYFRELTNKKTLSRMPRFMTKLAKEINSQAQKTKIEKVTLYKALSNFAEVHSKIKG
jgi:hypothetical protein